jgi:hypothetical protein
MCTVSFRSGKNATVSTLHSAHATDPAETTKSMALAARCDLIIFMIATT